MLNRSMLKLCIIVFITAISINSFGWEGKLVEIFRYNDGDPASEDSLEHLRCNGADVSVADGFGVLGNALKQKFDANNWTYLRHQNTAVDYEDFLSDADNWSLGVDSGDILLYMGHAGWNLTHGFWFSMGDNRDDCTMYTGRDGFTLGTDTNIFISAGCNQGRYDMWNGYYHFENVRSGQLAVWNAWHGNAQPGGSSDYGGGVAYDEFVDNAWDNGVSRDWINLSELASDETAANGGGEYCLISVTWGTDADEAREHFDAGLKSPPSGTGATTGVYWFVAGCCPWDGKGSYCDDQLPGPHGVKFYKHTHNNA